MDKENIPVKPVILLVDDNPDILEYLARILAANYQTLQARDGLEALQVMATETVHLVISDVMMPGMDGFDFCRNIKSNIEISHIPIILLTARNTLQARIEGLELGADAYIDKPFSTKHLEVQIANLLQNRNKVKEYFAKSPVAHLNSMAFTRADEQFLDQVNEVIVSHMGDTEMDVEHLARYMNMSRPTLYRKLKDITDLSPNELINLTRLKRAAFLLKEGKLNINEIVEAVGYASDQQFRRNFQKQFGMMPSEFKAT